MAARHGPRTPRIAIASPPRETWIDVKFKFGAEEDLVDPLFGIQGGDGDGDGIDWPYAGTETADLPLALALDTSSSSSGCHAAQRRACAFPAPPSPWSAPAWATPGAYSVDGMPAFAGGPYEPFDPLFLGPQSAALVNAGPGPSPYACGAGVPIPIPIPLPARSEYSFGSESSYAPAASCAETEAMELDALFGSETKTETRRRSPCVQQLQQQQQLAPPQQHPQRQQQQQQRQQQPEHTHAQPATPSSSSSFSSSFSSTSTSSSSPPTTAFAKLSWIHCGPSASSGRLVTLQDSEAGAGAGCKRPRGRKSPLTAAQKRDAARMRVLKACESCRRRKEKCDAGVPCRACIEHYKLDHVQVPCRGKLLSDEALHGAPAAAMSKRSLARAARVDHGGF